MTPALTDADTPAPAVIAAMRTAITPEPTDVAVAACRPIVCAWHGRVHVYIGAGWKPLTIDEALRMRAQLDTAITAVAGEFRPTSHKDAKS